MPRKKQQWPPKGSMVTYRWVSELKEALTQMDIGLRQSWSDAEDAYDGQLNLGIRLPKGIPIHRPSTGSSKVDSAAAHIITAFPQVKIKPSGNPGKRNVARDSRLAKAADRLLEHFIKEESTEVFETLKHDMVLLGSACMKLTFDEDEWPEPPEDMTDRAARQEWADARKHSWPFQARAVHPKNVYTSPDKRWPYAFVIEEQERFAIDLWMNYPGWSPKTKYDPADRVEWLEYWDSENYVAFAGGVEVFHRPNIHGVPPYIVAEVQRRSAGKGQGLLSGPVLSELQAEARGKTALDALWQQIVFPRIKVQKDEANQIRAAWNMGPAGVIPVEHVDGDEKSIGWLEMPQLNTAMFQFLPMIADSIRSATFDDALLGQRPSGVDFGVHQALLIGQARQSLRPYVNAMNRLASSLVNLFFRYIENVLMDDLILPSGEKVSPADINSMYNAEVSFEPVSQEDDDRRTALGLQILQSKALPWQTVLTEYFKRHDAEEQMVQVWAEMVILQLVQSGMLSEAVMQSATAEEAAAKLESQVQKITQQAGPQIPGFAGEEVQPAGGELGNRLVPGGTAPLDSPRGDIGVQ